MRSREAKKAAIIAALMGLLMSLTASADERAVQFISQQQVEETLRHYILTTGVWEAQQIGVRALSYKAVPVRQGKLALRVAKPAKGITPGIQTFLLSADVEGREESQIWVRTEIKVHDNVVVSARPLARRQVIGAEDVRLDWREIQSSNPRPFTKIEDAIGKQAARATNANEVLTSSLAEPPQVVRHGGPVVLIYESERLRVEARGEALQAGKVGDVIRVKNPASGKLLQGVVIDGRTVKVSQ